MRLGYVLTEEETEKVAAITDHLEIDPDQFFTHCIDVMWSKLNG